MTTREVFTGTGGTAFDPFMQGRTAAQEGAFLLPHLRPGMRVLDCGCGPGTITIGLAEAVAPGCVVGVDTQTRYLAEARALAIEKRIGNLAFVAGSAYALPFADAAFDAAFANSVLMHLRDPLAALRELRRVLTSRGIVGIRDADLSAEVVAPATPQLVRWQELWLRVLKHNGASPGYARHQRSLLLEAGFARSEAQASVRGGGTPTLTRDQAQNMRSRLAGAAGWSTAIAQGWTTQEEVEQLHTEVLAWGERPDAFFARPYYSAVGWVSD